MSERTRICPVTGLTIYGGTRGPIAAVHTSVIGLLRSGAIKIVNGEAVVTDSRSQGQRKRDTLRPVHAERMARIMSDGRHKRLTDSKCLRSDGEMYSAARNRYLQHKYDKKGYRVTCGVKGRSTFIHVLLLEEFVGPRPSGAIARHIDGNPKNCSLSNLEWSTLSQNALDVKWHRKHAGIKIYPPQVRHMKDARDNGESIAGIARRYQVSERTASRVVRGLSHMDVK